MKHFVRLYLILPFAALFLIGCSNPKYKKYHIVNNDTIAEIYVPSGSQNGILILWPKVDIQNKEEIENICKIMVSDKKAIRKTNGNIHKERRANLLVYKKNYSYVTEDSYINDDSLFYLFLGSRLDNLGYVVKKNDVKYGNLTKFRSGLKFKVNGKFVEVVKSSQYYIAFYTPERLTESESVLIKQMINRYGVTFTMTEYGEDLSPKSLEVSPRRRSLYFFDTLDTDYQASSFGNYIAVTGNLIFNFDNDETKSIDDVKSINIENDSLESLFDFMDEENVYLKDYVIE